jgi:hypothetical protein
MRSLFIVGSPETVSTEKVYTTRAGETTRDVLLSKK